MSSTIYGTEPRGGPELVAYTSLWGRSLVYVMGEAEQRARFARALQEAMDAQEPRPMSARALALRLGIDPRRVAGWLKGKALPTVYESMALAAALDVDEDIFRNPPEVPAPPPKPYYPIEKYLLRLRVDRTVAVGSGLGEGVRRLGSRAPRAGGQPPRSPARRARAV